MKRGWNLDPDEFRSALAKGLGRAVLHAREHGLSAEHQEALRAVCLEPTHWYNSDEETVPWLLDIADLAEMRDSVTSAVLRAVSAEGADQDHLCCLLHGLAVRDIAGARDALYELLRTGAQRGEVPGWFEVLALDGPRVFERASDALFRDERLLTSLLDYADDRPRKAAREALETLSFLPEAREMLRGVLEAVETRQAAPKEDRASVLRALSVADILDAAQRPSDRRASMFRGWSRVASDSDLAHVAEAMFAAQSGDLIARLLMAFASRALPAFDERFLALVDHPDERVRHRSLRVLGNYGHPKVRKLALNKLSANVNDANAIYLFRLTYQPGDHVLFEPFFADVEDPDEMHDRGFDLLEVFEHNRVPECSTLVQRVYTATPCSLCRERAVKILVDLDIVPDWLVEECGNDACGEIRQMVMRDRAEQGKNEPR